jgi:succinoglycan biosynthesis transport protein ExoP
MGDYNEQQFHELEEREVHLRDYLQIILKRKGTILCVFILVFLITVIKTYTATPYYTTSSRVLIERNEDTRGLNLGLIYGYEPYFLYTQAEIIKSLNVARRVVTSLDLAKKYQNYFFPPADAQPSLVSSVRGSMARWLSGLTSFFVSETKQETHPPAAVEKPNQTDLHLAKEKILAGIISGGLSVEPLMDTKIVSISYTGRDPAMVALITNAVVTAYMDEMLEIKIASSGHAIRWMTAKAGEERVKLEESERVLQQYKRDNDLVTIEDKMAIYPQKLNDLSSQLRPTR